MTKIELSGGKYTVTHDNGNNLKALRYGEEWRNLVGDRLLLALVQRIEELENMVCYHTIDHVSDTRRLIDVILE